MLLPNRPLLHRMRYLCLERGRSREARARGGERRRGWTRGRAGDQSYRSPVQEREEGLERVLRNMSCKTWSRTQREKRIHERRCCDTQKTERRNRCGRQLGRRTNQSRYLQRSSKRRKRGKSEKGMGKFSRRRLVDCGRRFPGSVSACVYKGFGQNFPLFQSSLEIPWSPSLPPRHRHTLSVTPLLPPRPLLSTLVLYPIPAK